MGAFAGSRAVTEFSEQGGTDMRNVRLSGVATLAIILASVAACKSQPHRDVMLFGTKTKFAIDIALQPETQTPEFTVGYKRQEFVYLPLTVNAQDSAIACPEAGKSNCAKADSTSLKYRSERHSEHSQSSRDSYSVFASFGAKFGGGSRGTDGGLAQFFATGIAAQELGKNTSIGNALAVQPVDAGAAVRANQASAAAISVLETALTASERRAIDESVGKVLESRSFMIDAIIALSRKNGEFDASMWSENIDKLPAEQWSPEMSLLKEVTTEEGARFELTRYHAKVVVPLHKALTK
jgi:hypothetical protein